MGPPDTDLPNPLLHLARFFARSVLFISNSTPRFNLGRVRFMQGDLGAARRSFEEALRHEPDYPAARMALEYLDATIGKPI